MGRYIGRVAITFLICMFLSGVPVRSQKVIKVIKDKVDRAGKSYDEPLPVFKGLERAWGRGDAEKISRLIGGNKIFLDVRGIGRKGGYFSRSQARFLFKRMFETATPRKFKFTKYHNLDKPGRRVHGVARRSYKNVRNGRLFQDTVYVTLCREGRGWVVSEIKTTR